VGEREKEMIERLAGLLTWKIKLAVGIALILGVIWFFKHAETVAYEKGVASGKQQGWDDAEKQMRQTMAAEWKTIADDAAALDEIGKRQQAQRTELERTRNALSQTLANRISEITAANIEQKTNVEKLPTTDLVPRIQHVLDDLDLLEAQRARRTGPAAN
jgi:hypothetical protein